MSRFAFLLAPICLGCLLLCAAAGRAQCPCGNLTGQEYGDAVYREMGRPLLPDYNHTAIFAGLRPADGQPRVLEVYGDELPDDTTLEGSFASEFLPPAYTYYGAYTLAEKDLTFAERRSIVSVAQSLADAVIAFSTFEAINYQGASYGGTIDSIESIRCDGFVEFAYESLSHKVWWNTKAPSQWSILDYPARHNETPTLTREPATVMTPWAQRGAPAFEGVNPGNTRMTRPAVVTLPTYEVTQVTGDGWADVTIRAQDVSGIHQIFALPSGANQWLASPVQPQHPLSDAYAYTIRVQAEGDLVFFAVDGAGNMPPQDQYQSVRVSFRLSADPRWIGAP